MAEKQGFAKLEDHELFADLENELDSRNLDEKFFKANPEQAEDLYNALTSLQTVLDNVESQRDAWAEEQANDVEDDEDED